MLREEGIVRIYDIFFDYDVLPRTDAFFRKIIQAPGVPARDVERRVPRASAASTSASARRRSASAAVARCSASPTRRRADLHVVARRLVDRHERRRARARGKQAARSIRTPTSTRRRRSCSTPSAAAARAAVLICGGGSPKNFMLQTEPQIQEVLGIDEKGHDYFLQITDARPDTGGLSGATPADGTGRGANRADARGSNRPVGRGGYGADGRDVASADGRDPLPNAVVCYADATIALPLLTAYALARREPREPERLSADAARCSSGSARSTRGRCAMRQSATRRATAKATRSPSIATAERRRWMRIAVTGSTGLVGTALLRELRGAGHAVTRVVRRPPKDDTPHILWDPAAGRIDAAGLEGHDAVVHLAGESVAGLWTRRKRAAIHDSRVDGTRLLAETLADLNARRNIDLGFRDRLLRRLRPRADRRDLAARPGLPRPDRNGLGGGDRARGACRDPRGPPALRAHPRPRGWAPPSSCSPPSSSGSAPGSAMAASACRGSPWTTPSARSSTSSPMTR